MMIRQKAFQTAAARRKANPIEWVIDGVSIRLKSSADLLEVADLIDGLQAEISDDESQIKAANDRRLIMVALIRSFVDERDVESFDALVPDLDINLCVQLTSELLAEYTGQENPTQPRSSSDGSQATGSPSTAGALPTASTQAR
jgi:hypothetical protein